MPVIFTLMGAQFFFAEQRRFDSLGCWGCLVEILRVLENIGNKKKKVERSHKVKKSRSFLAKFGSILSWVFGKSAAETSVEMELKKI